MPFWGLAFGRVSDHLSSIEELQLNPPQNSHTQHLNHHYANCEAITNTIEIEQHQLVNRFYAQGFIFVCVLRFLKYSSISSLVILDNFSLNLSRC